LARARTTLHPPEHSSRQQLEPREPKRPTPRHAAVRTERAKPVAGSATPPDTRPQFPHFPANYLYARTRSPSYSSLTISRAAPLHSSSVQFDSWLPACLRSHCPGWTRRRLLVPPQPHPRRSLGTRPAPANAPPGSGRLRASWPARSSAPC
jgi:hypothetical protein